MPEWVKNSLAEEDERMEEELRARGAEFGASLRREAEQLAYQCVSSSYCVLYNDSYM